MTIECFVADLTGYLFTIMPEGMADQDLTPERFGSIKQQVIAKLNAAEQQIACERMFAAPEDEADQRLHQEFEEADRG